MTTPNKFISPPSWLKEIINDPFRSSLYTVLVILGAVLIILTPEPQSAENVTGENTIHFFFHPTCPHCRTQKKFNRYLVEKYPEITVVEHDTSLTKETTLLNDALRNREISPDRISVPVTIIGPYVIFGFDNEKNSGLAIEKALSAYLENDPSLFTRDDRKWLAAETIQIPLFGNLQLNNLSLPALAVIIGLADGFNPCAMWVLVYLISLIVSIGDKTKIWFLVGSFVLASGILYFLFMTAWLNVFLLIGYIRPLTIIIGLFAIGTGLTNIREYIHSRGSPSCSVGDGRSKKQTMGRIEAIISQPLTVSTVAGIITLAFIVNSIEFACSAALPAIFTHILALRDLSTGAYYGYMFLYVVFFMLDDLVIFSLAAFAMSSGTGQRYAKHCTILGGLVLLGLGLIMAFQPDLLR